MSDPRVLLSCAITGGMSVPGQSAAIPITPEEIVDSAVAAHAAGAASPRPAGRCRTLGCSGR
jgi:uncharacterized protein (DUF849 family)